jgi:uncharacterized protein YeaO (DUF488 family)
VPSFERGGLKNPVKRVYELPDASDGATVLVDRIWPRGLTKEHASVDENGRHGG